MFKSAENGKVLDQTSFEDLDSATQSGKITMAVPPQNDIG